MLVVNELAFFLDEARGRIIRRMDGGQDVMAEGVEAFRVAEEGDGFIGVTIGVRVGRFPRSGVARFYGARVLVRNP